MHNEIKKNKIFIMINMTIFSFIGTIGFTIGGILFSFLSPRMNKKVIAFIKGFSLGTVIILLIGELFKHAMHALVDLNGTLGIVIALSIVLLTITICIVLHYIFERKDCDTHHHDDCSNHHIHIHKSNSKFITVVIFLVSIALHNIPEGLSLGATFVDNEVSGILMSTFVLGLHNFVIGYTISDKLLESTSNKKLTVLLTLSSSVLAFISAVCGYFIGTVNELLEGIIVSIGAGAMIFIILKELAPDALKKYDNLVIVSICVGLIATAILLRVF